MAVVLLTGAPGFIGQHVAPALRAAGHEVLEVGRDSGNVADQETWRNYPDADVVVHLAARTFVPDSWSDPAGFLQTNLHGTVCALSYCQQRGATLVFLSSYLYGHPKRLPVRESAPLDVTNPYALSKKMAEDACRFFADRCGVPVTILRPFNVYGPGQSSRFLIPSLIEQVRLRREIHVKDVDPKRDYVYIDDLVDAITKSVSGRRPFSIINIGTGVSHSVQEVIDEIQAIAGTQLVVRSSQERRPDEMMDTRAAIARARTVLGWRPRWTLAAGLRNIMRQIK